MWKKKTKLSTPSSFGTPSDFHLFSVLAIAAEEVVTTIALGAVAIFLSTLNTWSEDSEAFCCHWAVVQGRVQNIPKIYPKYAPKKICHAPQSQIGFCIAPHPSKWNDHRNFSWAFIGDLGTKNWCKKQKPGILASQTPPASMTVEPFLNTGSFFYPPMWDCRFGPTSKPKYDKP